MTNEEFKEWCEDRGLNSPRMICESCGSLNHYHCFQCHPKHFQPERSKREDALKECSEIGHMNTWMPKNQTLCMRCGALNSMET